MTTILVADDHRIIRDGIVAMLEGSPDYHVIGEASNGKEVISFLEEYKSDIVIMDINMAVMDGIKATQEVTLRFPATKIIALSMHEDKPKIKDMMAAGARGYLYKGASKNELLVALQNVVNGQQYFSSEILNVLLNDSGEVNRTVTALSTREIEILKLITEEYTNPEIAEKLFLSIRTVDTHRRNLLQKLDVKNTAGLVKYALKNNIL